MEVIAQTQIEAEISRLLNDHCLEGALIAESSGRMLVNVGSFAHDKLKWLCVSPEGYRPWIPQTPEDIAAANADLEGKILPQMAAQGDATAYFMRPAPGYYAVAASVHPRGGVREDWEAAKRIAEAFASAVTRSVQS